MDSKTVHGQAAGVRKLQTLSAASRLPARSVTPADPLLTVAVYVLPSASGDGGVSVAVRVCVVVGDRGHHGRARVVLERDRAGVDGARVERLVEGDRDLAGHARTPVACAAGDVDATLGARVSGGRVRSKVASTQ